MVATLFQGQLGIGPQTFAWDGTGAARRSPTARYVAV